MRRVPATRLELYPSLHRIDDFEVVTADLWDPVGTGRIQAPLEHVPVDDDGARHAAVAARCSHGRVSTSRAPAGPGGDLAGGPADAGRTRCRQLVDRAGTRRAPSHRADAGSAALARWRPCWSRPAVAASCWDDIQWHFGQFTTGFSPRSREELGSRVRRGHRTLSPHRRQPGLTHCSSATGHLRQVPRPDLLTSGPSCRNSTQVVRSASPTDHSPWISSYLVTGLVAPSHPRGGTVSNCTVTRTTAAPVGRP